MFRMAKAPFSRLTPDRILDAVETLGFTTDGRLLALNSFENRVYRVGIGEGRSIIAKFYRPDRWDNDQILEEHAFIEELSLAQLPVIAPLKSREGLTLHALPDFRFSLWPMQPGRTPDLEDSAILKRIGLLIGRIHAIGAIRAFKYRITINARNYGYDAAQWLVQNRFIPVDLIPVYTSITKEVLSKVEALFNLHPARIFIRLHGDCHPGNLLWTEAGCHFVDLDDCLMGPAIQDLWMLLSGDRDIQAQQLQTLVSGYNTFHRFDPSETLLIEPLRTLRMIHYAAWLGSRWTDPAFHSNFPWFNTQRYWQEQILALREQSALLDEPPLLI
ncbi:MAG: serine/threonine protein kinase [Pseudomonadota bacterium]|nr:serine/threonine protein kinase [Pseudomonadota bacterium]